MKKIQLVVPAGNNEKLSALISKGADTVFLGGRLLSINAGTDKFSDEELITAVNKCKEKGVKVQLLLNAVPHNSEIQELPEYIKYIESIGVESVVVSDLGVFQCVKEFSNLNIVVSTHSSNTNWRSVEMWKKIGAKKVILDRDLSIDGIIEIRSKVPDIELEVFVHGPILLAISGRKILNNYMAAHKINKPSHGDNYSLVEETRPGEYMPVYEGEYGTYIYGARELCTIDILEKLLNIGIDSIRIEGGMKPLEKIQEVVAVYKEALDIFQSENYIYNAQWMDRLKETSNAPFVNWYICKINEEVRN